MNPNTPYRRFELTLRNDTLSHVGTATDTFKRVSQTIRLEKPNDAYEDKEDHGCEAEKKAWEGWTCGHRVNKVVRACDRMLVVEKSVDSCGA